MACAHNMSVTRPLCYVVWLLSLVAVNHFQPEEPRHKQNVMKVCPRQQTTENLMHSFEVFSLNECALRCTSEMACKSANLCSFDHSKVCTLSTSFSLNTCDNTVNSNCIYLITETPCLHGGTLDTARHCVCTPPYTGDFCERMYYDCSEPGCVDDGETWIQRGSLPPILVYCIHGYTYFITFDSFTTYEHFPLNKTFVENKSSFTTANGFLRSGLESIHMATSQAYHSLGVTILRTRPNMKYFTVYENFTLGSESERYRLDYMYKSSGPDVFANMKGRPFSAIGNDPEGCSQMHNVAWWYTADCKLPMIYNANGKISVPDKKDGYQMYAFLNFSGFK